MVPAPVLLHNVSEQFSVENNETCALWTHTHVDASLCRGGAWTAVAARGIVTEHLGLAFDVRQCVVVVGHAREHHPFLVVVLTQDLVVTHVELVADTKPTTDDVG